MNKKQKTKEAVSLISRAKRFILIATEDIGEEYEDVVTVIYNMQPMDVVHFVGLIHDDTLCEQEAWTVGEELVSVIKKENLN